MTALKLISLLLFYITAIVGIIAIWIGGVWVRVSLTGVILWWMVVAATVIFPDEKDKTIYDKN